MNREEFLEMDGFTRSERRMITAGICDADEVACAKECREPSPFLNWLQEVQREAA